MSQSPFLVGATSRTIVGVEKLFAQDDVANPPAGRLVGVAVNSNVWRVFDYLWPDSLGQPELGQRVRVPFGMGNRGTVGFVADLDRPSAEESLRSAAQAGQKARKFKPVHEVVDAQSQFDPVLWKLGAWISHYYLTPLGMTLAAMVPSAVGKHAPRQETIVRLAKERKDWPDGLRLRQKTVLDELYEARKQGITHLTLGQLLKHSQASRDTIHRLVNRGLIELDTQDVILPELNQQAGADPFDLNAEQQAALAAIGPRLAGGFSVTLLHGVTGSGKTEVYVQAIRQVVAAGKQAILMAPEIALATQTLSRLIQRLPRVAILHSGMTDAQRAYHYQQIRDGHAAVVVGPRSAIFAPTRKLGLIIVDEEHEPSYKQDTAPRYHGRDTAVMRASLASVPIVLGSATPSLESLLNAQQGKYHLLRLTRRVRDLPMPKLNVVPLRQEMEPGKIELIGKTLTARMAVALDSGGQIILLLNRRGYASYVFCPSCGWIQSCSNCTRAMVFHQATRLVLCHYCQHTELLPEACPACKKKLLLFGFGIQRIESELARKFPTARLARMDSDTMTSPRQFQKVFDEFGAGQIDILLGTQMVAKGLDFPKVSLVGVVSADTSLHIPDFRAAERTFQLIVQVAGRAGRSDRLGEVVVQTLHPEEPAIQFALTHDYDHFAQAELLLRKEIGFPPFGRLLRFLVRHEKTEIAEQGAAQLAADLKAVLPAGQYTMIGPQLAQVAKVRNQFRFQILLKTPRAGTLQQALAGRMEDLCRKTPAEILADIDPLNLL